MTLKKFLKKYVETFADVYNNGEYLGQSLALDKKYKEWRVDKVFCAYSKSDLRCGIVAINIEPPKEKPIRSTDNKAYKKWMKKYVKDHMDEIGLKDGEDAMD
jgi:hypothetical protein